jgi:LmbE family N-acetylglucosaminyl deacetylase
MKGRRVGVVVITVVGVWLLSFFFHARGPAGSHLVGTRSAGAVDSAPATDPRTLPVHKPMELSTSDTAPPRLLVSNNEMQVPTGLRLMVFTPHPDDETLAAGGLIQRVLAKEGKVQVVFVTNGDAFRDAVIYELGRMQISTNDFIEYGEQRHDEAIHAMSGLGLGPDSSVFLGFPDGGIDDLWADNWSRGSPYTSPFTHFDRPLYKECLTKKLQYSGANLVEEMSRMITDFEPDWVVLPDPRDKHPDHFTAGLFVLDALRKLKQEREECVANTQVFTYLIHFPDYPTLTGWVKRVKTAGLGGVGAGCAALSSTQWLNLPITDEELEGKKDALTAYKSQVIMMGGFFQLFLHSYEIFGKLDADQIMIVPREYAAQSRSSN